MADRDDVEAFLAAGLHDAAFSALTIADLRAGLQTATPELTTRIITALRARRAHTLGEALIELGDSLAEITARDQGRAAIDSQGRVTIADLAPVVRTHLPPRP